MKRTTTLLLASLLALCAPLASALADDYVVNVAYGATQTINASFVSALGSKNLVKTGRGTLVSSNVMSNYTGTITIRGGAFEVKTTSDLGTGDGGTVVEDGGTLVVNMANSEERFRNESFTIAGTGDAAYGAAVYQASGKNNRFKLFKYLALSGDATIYAGTHLGVDGGPLTMNGHTLTVKGANFSLRTISTPSPVGDLVTETKLIFEEGGSGSIGDPAKTLTAQNGGRPSFQDASQTILWKVVVGSGGSIYGHENDATISRESNELDVQANPATGALSVRDKRTGREWHTAWVPAAIGTPSFEATPSFTLSGAELVVEADFSALSDSGSVFPSPLTPNPGDALVIPMSEGFRIPFDECDILKGGELEAWRGSSLSMPFFGVVDENDESGFMVLLETPDDAKIKCFADASDFGVGAIAPLWVPECGSPGYTRRVRFVFFESGGYVAMAKRYRAYAASQGLVKTFAEKAAERPLVERLPGAANIWYFPSSGEPSHTAVAAELREAGIDRFLWSWNSAPRPTDLAAISGMTNTLAGRYDVARDVYYPDLLDALGMANPPASEITLNTSAWPNDVMWDSADSNDWRRGWTVTGTNGATYHCAAQCDIPAIARMRQLAGGDLTANPYTARFIDVTTAKGLEECYNPAHPMTRRVSRAKKTELLEMLGDEFGIVVGSEQGMDAFVPVCDYFEGMLSPTAARMPARRDGYGRSARFRDDGGVPSAVTSNEWAKIQRYGMNERYRIPLFELVYHDCVAAHWYWYDYSNSPVYWWWKRDMFNALYGTAPMYIFDYQLWSERRAEFLASWRRVGGIARKTGFSEMVSHRSLAADRSVQETRFADGTVVVADFTSRTMATGIRTNQTYTVDVPEGQTMSIDATFVAALGSDNLAKTGRGVLVSSNVMSNYTGTITVREGAFVVTSDSDLGTADGGTTVEDGATLVIHANSTLNGLADTITVEGAGDAAYGAAIYQAPRSNNQFKALKYLVLSGDATIYAGTHLGVNWGTLAMNGHTLTVQGQLFTLRHISTPATVGDIMADGVYFTFDGNGGYDAIGDGSRTFTLRNGASVQVGDSATQTPLWKLVAEEGGKVVAGSSSMRRWGDVEWNSTVADGVTGLFAIDGELSGTGVVHVASGTLTLANPPSDTVGLAAAGTAFVVLPPAKAYSYEHKGLLTGYRTDGWTAGFDSNRADTRWSYCSFGPGPQIDRSFWGEGNGQKEVWCSRGYLWNREATNVTVKFFIGNMYQSWVYLDGTCVYDNKRDSWVASGEFEIPAGTCRSFEVRTNDGGAANYGGPRTDNDKFKINGVIANDPTGWFFTTNAVSGAENASNLAALELTGDGAIDMQGMPLAVDALSGAGLVTNVTTLTVADSWSLGAADIADGAKLVVDGDLVFGNGCVFNVSDLRSLPVSTTSTVCRAESISGIPAGGIEITSGQDVWRLVLANGGTELSLVNVEHVTGRTLVLAGDSTLDEHGGDESTYGSWGSNLRPYLVSGNSIVNYGRGGRSTSSFIREGWWDRVLDAAGAGDFVLVQFGHNDQKLDDETVATPIPQYKTNLVEMAEAVRAKGATPVFATPIVRLNYSGGRISDTRLDEWATAMREVAEDESVDLVDMREMTRQLANDAGEAEALTWYVDGDRTHPAPKGARLYAELFIDDVFSRNLPVAALFSASAASGDDNPIPIGEDEFEVYVPFGQTQTIDAALVAEIGEKNLVKTGRGTLRSSDAMAGYTGEITVRAGSLVVTTASDLGTGDGGTTVESGATLVVHMSASTQRFSNEAVTIAGDGDAMHGAAIWQSSAGNDQFKIFKYLTLSGDATIFAGTRLGVDGGTVTMNGHTLTLKGANFTFRNDTFPAPVGNIVTEANLAFMNGSGTIGDPSKTLTVRNGGRVSIAENNMGVKWRLVVEEGGCFAGSASTPKHWGGDVVWNSTATNGVSGIVTFDGELSGTGVVTVASGALTLAKPTADTIGLAASGAASIEMPQPKAYSYEHKGLLTGYRTDGWSAGFDSDRADTRWSHCPFGPGPQIDRSFWGEGNGQKEIWCSRGYLWNREATNVTVTFFVGCVYQSWIYLDGSCVYDNKRDSWVSSGAFEIPAGTCKRFEVRTNDGGANVYGGPRTDNDKLKISGVIANDPTGWLFTTNAVSSVENPAAVASLMLADDGNIDAKNMPLSVGALSGAGLVTNVTALTVADSWTLAAADIADGAVLVVDGDVMFGNGSTISVSALPSLPVTQTYTICRADSITGLASDARIEDEGRVWKFVLSDGGTTLLLESVSKATMFYVR